MLDNSYNIVEVYNLIPIDWYKFWDVLQGEMEEEKNGRFLLKKQA